MNYLDLINQTKSEIKEKYKTDDLTDLCDVACENLSKKLKALNISGKIINGNVIPKWLTDEEEGYEYGHHWIEIGDLVLDPTNEQFGYSLNLFNKDHKIFSAYSEIDVYKKF